jgi:hypothetical protein
MEEAPLASLFWDLPTILASASLWLNTFGIIRLKKNLDFVALTPKSQCPIFGEMR